MSYPDTAMPYPDIIVPCYVIVMPHLYNMVQFHANIVPHPAIEQR